MKINYKLLMNKQIEEIKAKGEKPSLLLHSCCAPCASAVLEKLCEVFDVTIFFYNPNISPEGEFLSRLEEFSKLLSGMNLEGVEVVSLPYSNCEFETAVRGMENLKEGGERCKICYNLRLEKTFSYAKEKGFSYVATTLSVSPYKNAVWLNEIGEELSGKYGVEYLFSDFKKDEGYKRSCELSRKYGLYRQNYCGCVYSKMN